MVNFEDGELVEGAYVVIDGVEYPVHMPTYSGRTPLSSENLNKLQKDLDEEIQEETENLKEEIEKRTNFSSNEQIIGTWTNGKPIYRKIISGTTGTNTYEALSIIENLDQVIRLYGSSGSNYKGFPNWVNLDSSPQQFRQFGVHRNEVFCNKQPADELIQYYLILEYTKTTDVIST